MRTAHGFDPHGSLHRVDQRGHALDPDLEPITRLDGTDAGGGAREDHIARQQGHVGGDEAHQLEAVEDQLAGVAVLPQLPVLEELRDACEKTGTPLFSSARSCSAVIDQLRHYLARKLADTTSLHGVFMDVLGMGVMITGDSGSGKSELALELISRGHGLVADDVVELTRVAPSVIEGRCPGILRDFLEVRGLGLLNIRTIFGETASRRKMRLKLIVHLHRQQPGVDTPRLPFEAQTQEILGVNIRKVNIPVAAGRNLAVLLEAAVRNTILQFRGIDSLNEFIARQQEEVLAQEALTAKNAQRALALDPAHTIRPDDIDDPSI